MAKPLWIGHDRFAVGELASADPATLGALVRRLADRFPSEPALSLCFAITSAAARLEDLVQSDGRVTACHGYRLAALLSADIHAIQSMGQIPATATDLLHFWRRVDPYFLKS